MVNALNAYTTGLFTQNFTARTVTDTNADKTNQQGQKSSDNNSAIVDTVDISAGALQKSQEIQKPVTDPRVAYYQQFRPTHEGFSSYNMALGIVDPSAQPFSQNRSFEDVAKAARESIDNNHQKLKDIGKPYSYVTTTSEDQYSLFGELDRRALYAVASNEGGLFSKEEQSSAKDIMGGQQGMAMGLYNGPTALSGKFYALPPISNSDHARSYKAGIQFLDNAPAEEKGRDLQWAIQRASVQFGYESTTGTKGFGQYDSDNPLVKLIKAALDNAWMHEGKGNTDMGNLHYADELKSRSWFTAYADKYDAAAAMASKMYGLRDS
jgi:hypothetical protein